MNRQTVSAVEGFVMFIESLREPQPRHGRKEITALLDYTKRQTKKNWHVYSDCKRRLDDLNITCKQYQRAHRSIINILRV